MLVHLNRRRIWESINFLTQSSYTWNLTNDLKIDHLNKTMIESKITVAIH